MSYAKISWRTVLKKPLKWNIFIVHLGYNSKQVSQLNCEFWIDESMSWSYIFDFFLPSIVDHDRRSLFTNRRLERERGPLTHSLSLPSPHCFECLSVCVCVSVSACRHFFQCHLCLTVRDLRSRFCMGQWILRIPQDVFLQFTLRSQL